jgi:hypothetical protein
MCYRSHHRSHPGFMVAGARRESWFAGFDGLLDPRCRLAGPFGAHSWPTRATFGAVWSNEFNQPCPRHDQVHLVKKDHFAGLAHRQGKTEKASLILDQMLFIPKQTGNILQEITRVSSKNHRGTFAGFTYHF